MYGISIHYFTNLLKLGILHACASSVYQASPQGGGAWGRGYACYGMEYVHEITLLHEEISSPLQCLTSLGI